MTAPLFPEKLKIEQGGYGDCYLLAFMDCLFHAGEEGIKPLKDIFKETSTGIDLRLKRPAHTPNLRLAQKKYRMRSDPVLNEDIISLSQRELAELEKTPGGVKSNSIILPILEHIGPYFYVEEWDVKQATPKTLRRSESASAHETENARAHVSETRFLGQLLNIPTFDINDMDMIVNIKKIFPDEPIYLSLIWRFADSSGKKHDRHALRIDRITEGPAGKGEYYFHLVNPWNNQGIETFTYSEISKRDPQFAVINTNPHRYNIIKHLHDHPSLFTTVLQIKKLNPMFDPMAIIDLPSSSSFHTVSSIVLEHAKKAAETCIQRQADRLRRLQMSYDSIETIEEIEIYKESILRTANQLLDNNADYSVAQSLLGLTPAPPHPLIQQAMDEVKARSNRLATEQHANLPRIKNIIEQGVQKINEFPIRFQPSCSCADINRQTTELSQQLTGMLGEFLLDQKAISLLSSKTLRVAISERQKIISSRAEQEKVNLSFLLEQAEIFFQESGFKGLLENVLSETNSLELRCKLFDASAYKYSIYARKLALELKNAQEEFVRINENKIATVRRFHSTCQRAIKVAEPLLTQTSEWKAIIAQAKTIFDRVEDSLLRYPKAAAPRFSFFHNKVPTRTSQPLLHFSPITSV